MNPLRLHRLLVGAALLLAFGVVALGAYVRLSDAGLGCPDWPGCYGHWLGVPDEAHEQAQALAAFPGKPVETPKAWKEMTHRYLAGGLGLLILAIAVLSWRWRERLGQSPAVPSLLVAVVAFQALLGMWTVTLLLKPAIVTAHLLGGMTTLALLVWMFLNRYRRPPVGDELAAGPGLRLTAALLLLAVFVQIGLGGWVSSNYAALACSDFPTCQGRWLPEMDLARAFHLFRELGYDADGELLPLAALAAIHWMHRVGALIVSVLGGGLALVLWRSPGGRPWGLALGGVLGLQVGLGIANVLLSLPLPLAVAHNFGAALLLSVALALNGALARAPQPGFQPARPASSFS